MAQPTASSLPTDYLERTYAGVLGKVIGVYSGKPFEHWTHEAILEKFGEIWYYTHDRAKYPLIAPDDDLSGTFTFFRALEDYGFSPELSAAQIGRSWLHYVVENRTVLWWGGVGDSTEHTAYLRLKAGVEAPRSGSIELNGPIVAQQVGAQIFIDCWAMVAPGQPELAARLARAAASVSHDGEAVHGAVLLAAMESAAYVERDLGRLIDLGLSFVPAESHVARAIRELRALRAREDDWRAGLRLIRERFGYDRFPGGCHMVPNHAVIHLALLWGGDDFQRALMIANTAGFDTDCNAGNVGCLLGIKNGLAGLSTGPDWRGPVADRFIAPSADAAACVTDAAAMACRLAAAGHRLAGREFAPPKGGARFHFSLPGSAQGFVADAVDLAAGRLSVDNPGGRLALRCRALAERCPARASTPTFLTVEQTQAAVYASSAAPTLYSGQVLRAALAADAANTRPLRAALFVRYYGPGDALVLAHGPETELRPGAAAQTRWEAPDTGGRPIAQVGVEVRGEGGADGVVYLESLTWDGAARTQLRPVKDSAMWAKSWLQACDHVYDWYYPLARISQDKGRGFWITGSREWRDYAVSARLSINLARHVGLCFRWHGLQRYYAIHLGHDQTLRLARFWDGQETVLASAPCPWEPAARMREFRARCRGAELVASLEGGPELRATDASLTEGGIALLLEEGRIEVEWVAVEPA